jgi:hypothetical protein
MIYIVIIYTPTGDIYQEMTGAFESRIDTEKYARESGFPYYEIIHTPLNKK